MKISLNWLRDFVDCQLPAPELESLLRRAGLEVASIESRGAAIEHVVVAQILESAPHPNADRLSICQVNDGSPAPRQIVCGAKNYKVGDKVPLALPGAVMPGDFKIKVGKLRGVESEGMMCSAKELRLAEEAEGLLILSPDAIPGTPISTVFPPDLILELEITPNRGDWLSHLGVAREIGIFTGLAVNPPDITTPSFSPAENSVLIEADECSYYTLRKIRGVKVAQSPQWLCDRLTSIGLRPVNNVVDITNFVLFELGQPLHAFDAAKISGGLRVRHAAEGEGFRALDGRDYRLRAGSLAITDDSHIVALAGVMGGEDSAVTADTTEVFLESAAFDPASVRRTSRALGLLSDSSYRFERGVDPEMIAAASSRATALILELAGGHADELTLEAGSRWARPTVTLRNSRVHSVLGVDLPNSEIVESLSKIGLENVPADSGSAWKIPGFRREILREADLIEEIARLIGIDRIPSTTSAIFAPASAADAAYDFAMNARSRLAGMGFHEARTSTLVAEAQAAWAGLAVELKNPLGDDQSRLRTSLLPGLLTALKHNLDHGAASIRLFEYGRVFSTSEESPRLAFVLTGPISDPTWRGESPRTADLFDLRGIVSGLAGLNDDSFAPFDHPPEPFSAAIEVFKNGRRIGLLGILHPAEARKLDAPTPVLAAEIDAAAWLLSMSGIPTTSTLPKFPASVRDIALTAPLGLPFADVRTAIIAHKDPLLQSLRLFDLFTDPNGEKLPKDKKSLAISLTFRSNERTLTTKEVNDSVDRLKADLQERLKVDFRE